MSIALFQSTVRHVLIALTIALLTAPVAVLAQSMNFRPGPGPDELWDVTIKMEMVGMPMVMPAQTIQNCFKSNRRVEAAIPQQENCRTSDVRITGDRVTFKITCTGDQPMTGTGDITSSATKYEGVMALKSMVRGEAMEMSQKFSGRKVGTCTDLSK